MNEFTATFHTHADALLAHRALTAAGTDARMMPVPRKLSSSCGTCVRYSGEDPCIPLMQQSDAEAVYRTEGPGSYVKLFDGEEK